MQNQVLELSPSYGVLIGFTSRTFSENLDYRSVPMRVNSMADYERIFGGPPEFENLDVELDANGEISNVKLRFCLHASVQLFFANGGGGLGILTAGTYSDAMTDGQACLERAISVLEYDRMENLLGIPDAHWGDRPLLLEKAIAILAKRPNLVMIWDGAEGDSPVRVQEGVTGAGAVFGPWAEADLSVPKDSRQWWFRPELLKMAEVADVQNAIQDWRAKAGDLALVADGSWVDSLQGLQNFPLMQKMENWLAGHGPKVPLSGAVIGLLVRSDRQLGIWHSASGKTVAGILAPGACIEGMNGLVKVGAQVLVRSFLAWGGEGQHQWLQISRLRKSIHDNCSYYLSQFAGQPNVIEVWQMAANAAAAVMNELWRRGAFAGETSPEAWGVQIGIGSTMTEEDAANGCMVVQISFSPVHPSEFDELNIQVQMQPWT